MRFTAAAPGRHTGEKLHRSRAEHRRAHEREPAPNTGPHDAPGTSAEQRTAAGNATCAEGTRTASHHATAAGLRSRSAMPMASDPSSTIPVNWARSRPTGSAETIMAVPMNAGFRVGRARRSRSAATAAAADIETHPDRQRRPQNGSWREHQEGNHLVGRYRRRLEGRVDRAQCRHVGGTATVCSQT